MLVESFIFAGLPMTAGQLSFIGALTLTKDYGVITTLSFTTIIVGYLVSIFRYNEQVNIIAVLGALVIVVGLVFLVNSKDK